MRCKPIRVTFGRFQHNMAINVPCNPKWYTFYYNAVQILQTLHNGLVSGITWLCCAHVVQCITEPQFEDSEAINRT